MEWTQETPTKQGRYIVLQEFLSNPKAMHYKLHVIDGDPSTHGHDMPGAWWLGPLPEWSNRLNNNRFGRPVSEWTEEHKEAERERMKAYEVCKQRGHTPSGMVLTSNPPWQVCQFCGTNYRHETVLIEGYTKPVDVDA